MKTLRGIYKDIVTGLYDLHSHGMAHLDFKPENCIVKMVDGKPHAKIIDFGSMRTIGSDSEILCTITYCAPEALSANAVPSTACDAYSLGALLYYMFYKTYLFDYSKHRQPHQVRALWLRTPTLL